MQRRPLCLLLVAVVLTASLLMPVDRSWGYVEVAYTLGRVIAEATTITVLRVEKVDKEKNLIIYRKVQDIKGTMPDVVKHNIGRGGLSPREWPTIMRRLKLILPLSGWPARAFQTRNCLRCSR